MGSANYLNSKQAIVDSISKAADDLCVMSQEIQREIEENEGTIFSLKKRNSELEKIVQSNLKQANTLKELVSKQK